MIGDAVTAKRFMRAALLGVAMAVETQRILRLHMEGFPPDPDGAVEVEVPFPDSTVIAAVLDAAVACFEPEGSPSVQAARQAVLGPVLELASLAEAA
jgi:hypothetical protein